MTDKPPAYGDAVRQRSLEPRIVQAVQPTVHNATHVIHVDSEQVNISTVLFVFFDTFIQACTTASTSSAHTLYQQSSNAQVSVIRKSSAGKNVFEMSSITNSRRLRYHFNIR